MIKKYVVTGACCFILLNSCSNEKTKSEALIEANKVHLESVAILESVEKELDEKKKLAKTNNNQTIKLKLDSLYKLVELWEEGVLEVPGFEHEHHHGDGEHHHGHKPVPQMTDESMLEYQHNAKAAIKELQKDLTELKE